MPVTFYGKWSLLVTGKNAAFQERLRISGSAGSDGIVAGAVGQGVAAIDGGAWDADMEWSSDGVNWFPSRVHRIPGVTAADGLIVTLRADDNTPELGDGDFNDLVVELVYLNREVNPLGPGAPPYSYTVPPDSFWPQRPGRGVRGGCGCRRECNCRPAKPARRGCGCR
jgi:hypothetical protein